MKESKLLSAHKTAGFTLIELMIALVIGGIIVGAVYSTYTVQQRSYITQEAVAEMQQNIRAAMLFMSRDIRMAGYDPKRTGNFTITTTTPNSFVFSADINDDGIAGTLETLTYQLYTPPGASMTALRRIAGQSPIAENIQSIEFQYLKGDGNPFITPKPAIQSERNNIRAVRVSILARASRPDRKFTNTTTYTTASGTTWGPFNDNYRRRFLIATFQCRNMGL